ncbi:MAG: non-canonical purine NTP pyrophosphatase [Spirochaetaceae bacterium]|jgi:XTP/dITP diphosphohydrolase|nr:non-canonical purine NTP pyrophosphatase [Spirochaetaceae bacterium]
MTFWFASNNPHKAEELKSILIEALPPLSAASLKTPKEAGIEFDPDETGTTFMENALIKARALYGIVGEPVIADDSGLCIDALGGRPGIYSARYRGMEGGGMDGAGLPNLSDDERNAIVLREMEGQADRRARFVCAMALIDGKREYTALETLEGEIIAGKLNCQRFPPRMAGVDKADSSAYAELYKQNCQGWQFCGFGYDPILYLPGEGATVAGLAPSEKNRLSHRGKAARKIAVYIAEMISRSAC